MSQVYVPTDLAVVHRSDGHGAGRGTLKGGGLEVDCGKTSGRQRVGQASAGSRGQGPLSPVPPPSYSYRLWRGFRWWLLMRKPQLKC